MPELPTGGVVGIDPGLGGGISYVLEDFYIAWKMPKSDRDIWDLFNSLGEASFVVIEQIGAMPAIFRGTIAQAKINRSYGGLRMAVIGHKLRLEEVSSLKWQRAMKCLSKGDKRVTRAKAQELFPGIKVTHAIADSLLIGEYGRRVLLTEER